MNREGIYNHGQRMGSEIYGKVGGARVNSMGRGMDEIEFSDDEQALLQEPIYNGRHTHTIWEDLYLQILSKILLL